MTQELTLFDVGIEEPKAMETTAPEKKDKKDEKNSIKQKSGATKKKVEPKVEVKVHGDWTIHFATESFEVTDFVDEIPEEGVTLAEVREGLERAFPQFSAARTKWDVDETNKRLFPDAYAGSKGAIAKGGLTPSFFESEEEALESSDKCRYILNGDGKIHEVKQSVFGTMITEAKNIPLPITKERFEFALPKIPNKILRQIIGFFKSYIHDEANYEVALRIYWDLEEKRYVIECPEQIVTAVRIDLTYSNQYTGRNSLRYVPVLEVHSHNVMRAFFSSIDDADEQAYCIYGVFGRLNRSQIDMIFRVKSGNSFIIIPGSQIFEIEFENNDFSYPREWNDKVTVHGGFYL